jgi:hypothetical protein
MRPAAKRGFTLLVGAAALVLTISCDGSDSSWTGTTITPVATESSTSTPAVPSASPRPAGLVPGFVEAGNSSGNGGG